MQYLSAVLHHETPPQRPAAGVAGRRRRGVPRGHLLPPCLDRGTSWRFPAGHTSAWIFEVMVDANISRARFVPDETFY